MIIIRDYYKEITIGYNQNGSYTISTKKPKYSTIYETAVMLTELGIWHILDRTNDKEKSEYNHKKYISMEESELDKII